MSFSCQLISWMPENLVLKVENSLILVFICKAISFIFSQFTTFDFVIKSNDDRESSHAINTVYNVFYNYVTE